MTIVVKQFGDYLTSRPAGREALLAARAYSIPPEIGLGEKIELDFSGVKVLSRLFGKANSRTVMVNEAS